MSDDEQADGKSNAKLRGWVRFPRSVLGKGLDAEHLCLYLRILGAVNYADRMVGGYRVPVGSMVMAWRTLGTRLWPVGKAPSVNTLRKRLDVLSSIGLIEIIPTDRFTIVRVVNQDGTGSEIVSTHADTMDSEIVSKSATDRIKTESRSCQPPSTHIEEGTKEIRKEPKRKKARPGGEFVPPTSEEAKEYADSIEYVDFDAVRFVQKNEAMDWKDKDGNTRKNWKLLVQEWKRRESPTPRKRFLPRSPMNTGSSVRGQL